MQQTARSKGETMWAQRQVKKTKKKVVEQWLEQLEEKARISEVAKRSGGWSSTAERNQQNRARRLLEEKEALMKQVKRRFKKEVEKIEWIDKELQGLRQQAAGSSTEQEAKAAQAVAAVRGAGMLFEEGEAGSPAGCEQGLREKELEKQVVRAKLQVEEATVKLQ